MKLLYVDIARTMWAFDPQLLNTRGFSTQELFKKLHERYSFAKSPKHPLDLNEKGTLAFQLGTFVNSAKTPLNVTFTIYNNGFTAETSSSTDDATEFLHDLAAWMTKEFGFVIPSKDNLKIAYFSQITVHLDTTLSALNPKLQSIIKMLDANVKTLDGNPRLFDTGALIFWTQDVGQPLAPSGFRLERKWGAPFSSNQYFSQAPLETEQHLKLIGGLEKLLKP
jgi:hypothetical protein